MTTELQECKKRRYISLSRLLPNMITIAALCCGLTAVRFAMLGQFEVAVIFIFIAAVLDGLDGTIARLMNATSRFGAQLDSLSDIISFGIAPALVMHIWALQNVKGFGWAVALFFVVCCALRLARFNSMQIQEEKAIESAKNGSNSNCDKDAEKEEDKKNLKQPTKYFLGVPAPAGALLALFPLGPSLESGDMSNIILPVWFSMIYITIIAMLMISRIPTFSLKNIRIRQRYTPIVMIIVALIVVMLTIEPWYTLMLMGTSYLLSIPYIARLHKKNFSFLGDE